MNKKDAFIEKTACKMSITSKFLTLNVIF